MGANKLYEGILYVNGNEIDQTAITDFEGPVINAKVSDHRSLGMPGAVQFSEGNEAMTAKITFASWYDDISTYLGDTRTTQKFQWRSNHERRSAGGVNEEIPYVLFLTGRSNGIPTGNFSAGESATFEINVSVDSVRMEVDGVVLLEYDPQASIFKVNGVDRLAQRNANLGLT